MHKLPTLVGLLFALGTPLLPHTPLLSYLGNPQSLTARLLGQLYYISIVTLTLLIVVYWEKRPLSSIGIKAPTWSTLLWMVVTAIVLMKVISPLATWCVSQLKLPLFSDGFKTILALPIWFRVLAIVITGGIFEEVVYRGFAVERLSELTGNYWIGSFIALSIFSWMHYPLWGLGPVLTFYITGGFMTAIYLWKRDLLVTIGAHIIVDMVGLIFLPPLP
jgi:uncharacterized protein